MTRDINDIFSKLDSEITSDVLNYIVSIYKVNKDHRLFIELKDKYTQLADAEYVVYPNLNSSIPTRFLDANGKEIFSYDGGVSEFILISFDFDIELDSISIENPYVSELNKNGNFSW